MIIKIVDIPPEGRDVDFALDEAALNRRIALADDQDGKLQGPSLGYVFKFPVTAKLHLDLEGSTVMVNGKAAGSFTGACSRCTEEAGEILDIPVNIVLKPRTARVEAVGNDEDVSFGFYDGIDVDCAGFVEEFLILALPFTILCKKTCKGLCPKCGANLNVQLCGCSKEKEGDDRFAVLRGLKITPKSNGVN